MPKLRLKKSTGPRFALLCRVSTRGQKEKGKSLHDQEQRGREYAKERHGQVVKVFTGFESATRPAEDRALLQRVLREAERHAFDALWVIDKSRLSRSPATTEVVLARLAKLKIELHTAQGPVAIGSAEAGFIAIVEAAADLLSSTRSKERLQSSRETMLKNGEHAFGRWPWGRRWNKTTKEWEVDAEAKRQAQQLYRMCVIQRLGTIEIGRRLGWTANVVGKRMRSAGISKWPRRMTTQQGERTFTLTIPALLSPLQAVAIERRLKANLSIFPEHKRRSLLQGFVRCWSCGGAMSHTTSGDGDHRIYRHLPRSHRKGCTYQVPAPLLEQDVVDSCGELLTSSAKLKAAIEAAQKAPTLKDAQDELADVEEQIQKLEQTHKRLLHRVVYFEESDAKKLADEAKQINKQLETLRGTEEGLRVKLGKSGQQSPALITAQMRRLFGFRGVAVLALPKEKQRELVALVVGRASREAKEGIYVRNAALVSGRPAAWEWQLRGSLGLLAGTASRLDALQERSPAQLGRSNLRVISS
jgi:site-specific DNA recombinase